jgi:hypothetical protein
VYKKGLERLHLGSFQNFSFRKRKDERFKRTYKNIENNKIKKEKIKTIDPYGRLRMVCSKPDI